MKAILIALFVGLLMVGCEGENVEEIFRDAKGDPSIPDGIECSACGEIVSKYVDKCLGCDHPSSLSIEAYKEERKLEEIIAVAHKFLEINEMKYEDAPTWFKNYENQGLVAWVDKNGDGEMQYGPGKPFIGKPRFDTIRPKNGPRRVTNHVTMDNLNEVYYWSKDAIESAVDWSKVQDRNGVAYTPNTDNLVNPEGLVYTWEGPERKGTEIETHGVETLKEFNEIIYFLSPRSWRVARGEGKVVIAGRGQFSASDMLGVDFLFGRKAAVSTGRIIEFNVQHSFHIKKIIEAPTNAPANYILSVRFNCKDEMLIMYKDHIELTWGDAKLTLRLKR
jgi:hypothetical protein